MNGKRFLAVAVIVLVAFHPLSSQETVPPPASTETSSTEPAPAETTPAEPAAPSNDAFERAIFFGKKFFELKDYASAYEQLAKADSIHPDTSGLLFNMAVLLAKLNRYADAQVKMDRYLQLYPSGQEVALIKKLQLELDFQRELQKKRQADKDYEELFNRGKFLFGKGDFEGALKIFQEAAQKHPQDPAVSYNQAIAFEQIGSYVKATERYRRYLELNQNPPDKATIDQKIFVLETEIEDMRTKIVCSWCGHKLPVGSIWCHRCWHGPYLTSSATWNTRVCGAGATATRTTYFSDGRVARNEDLPAF